MTNTIASSVPIIPMDDCFYPGLLTEEEEHSIKRSPVWPLVLAVHHRSGRRLYAAAAGADKRSVTLATLEGYGWTTASFNGHAYSLGASDNASATSVVGTGFSTLPTLMKNIQSTKSGNLGDQLLKRVNEAVGLGHRQRIAGIFTAHRRSVGDMSIPNLRIDPDLTPELFKVLLEAGNVLDPKTAVRLQELYDVYLSAHHRRDKYKEDMIHMVQRPKWIVGPPMLNNPAVAGATNLWVVSCDDLSQIRSDRFLEAMLPNDIPPNTSVIPPRVYKWDAVDPLINDELKGALTFYKIYRQGLGQAEAFSDEAQMAPTTDGYHPDINAFTVGYRGCRYVVCDRLYQGA